MTRWLQKYRRGGLVELLQINKAPENERKIKGAVLADLRQQLQNPEGFSSYGMIVEWLEPKHGLTVEKLFVNVYKEGGTLGDKCAIPEESCQPNLPVRQYRPGLS